jgi:zinc transporter ZupT
MPVEKHGSAGGRGPEDELRQRQVTLRTQGFLALAFGFALGVTAMVFFCLFRIFGAPTASLETFVMQVHPNLWLSFLYGFIGGTLLAAIYNLLAVHELHLFGLEPDQD